MPSLNDLSPDRRAALLRRVALWFPAIVCGTYLVLHALTFLHFVEDDALISLRYTQRFLEGKGLTWNDGEYVEGYSNLLWVLGTALIGALGVDLVDSLRVLGLAGALAAVFAVCWAYRAESFGRVLPALAGGFVLAAVKPFAAWSVGGLEQCLLAGLLAWALVTAYPLLEPGPVRARAVVAPGLLLGFVCLTRPDGPLFTAACCLGLLLARGLFQWRNWVLGFQLAAIPFAFFVGQTIFRVLYYGAWLPNTAHAKLAFSVERVWSGMHYLGWAFIYAAPVVLAALAAVVLAFRDPQTARRVRFLLVPLVLWSLYTIFIGGDTFRARRHFVPDVPILALMVAQAADAAIRLGSRARAISWGAFAALGAVLLVLQPRDGKLPTPGRMWVWDGEAFGYFLRDAFGKHAPLLAVEPAGCLPYYSRLPSLDMLGLNDAYLIEHPPEDFGEGRVGHELGDGDYTLSRKPDILMFCRPKNDGGPCFRGSREIVRKKEFKRDYRLVHLESRQPRKVRTKAWFRAEDGKIGIVRTDDRIEIPGYLLATEHDGLAKIDRFGKPYTFVEAGKSAGYARLPITPGRWKLDIEFEGDAPHAIVRAPQGRLLDFPAATPPETPKLVEVPGKGGMLTLELRNEGEKHLVVRKVTLERAP